ncbi:alkaline phosphatase-like protein [Gonapodya prolifera JEL478]|uniref:Alkaline phosphatase-like protein n=1 Tax=Gonapodya prolifera (strain JEL478) TaxID=1344416 RepID=A0A139AJ59_GONPJ|nr:alkaline phosphatase-like protein [Gonapodya prolifera JEL478]|eukprot:KXS16822.1 alkaline phosphatase-like protein [Gonapodya prolifera JEL478]
MSPKRPNFLVIVADDLGFSDVGAFGGEISTPNLDKLVESGGHMFTGFHTASTCSPTRSMLMSGTDNHLAGLGQMAELMEAAPRPWKGRPGYEGVLNWRVAALPEILKEAGYHTIMSGKWHLGMTKEYAPCSRGFEKVFTLLPGAAAHYLWEPVGDTGEPLLLFQNLYMEGDKFIPTSDLPRPFYSSDVFANKMLDFLKARPDDGRPFFAYLPFTAPHWPLQADPAVIAKYRGKYDDGPEALRERRLQALVKLGLMDPGVTPSAVVNPWGKVKKWDSMTDDEKKVSSRCMEVYAAMVEQMDQNIGRVIDYLDSTGELDNTFVLFMSDNGAEGVLLEALPFLSNVYNQVKQFYNNALDNIGNKDSFVWYGPYWAQAATAPSRLFKGYVAEGGTRTPLIVRYPRFDGLAAQGKISHEFVTVMDILPTILDLAGVPHPGTTFQGRKVHKPRGKSWVPYLTGLSGYVHDDKTVTGWELFMQQAIRKGDWKAIYIPAPLGPDRWQLYNVKTDPGETKDLANIEKAKLKELVDAWTVYVAETGTVIIPPFTRKVLGWVQSIRRWARI